jgi:hypothetical protein
MQVDCPVYKALVNDEGFIRSQVGPEEFVVSEHTKIPAKSVPPELNRSVPVRLALHQQPRQSHVMKQKADLICTAKLAEELPQQGAS